MLPRDDGMKTKTATKSSLMGSSSPLWSFSPRDGNMPTRGGVSRSKVRTVSSKVDAAAPRVKTPELAAKVLSASTPQPASSYETASPDYFSTLDTAGTVQRTPSGNPVKGVGDSKMLRRTKGRESTRFRR
ncbi:hypothetical protein MRX96_052474 [Rhipicephalus microplus]